MTAASARRRLLLPGLIAVLAIVDGVLLAGCSTRAPGSPDKSWSEVGASDPRVAGVFATLRQRGLGAALDSLEREAAADSLVLRGGHQLAHALGRQALTASGGDARVIGQCRAVFASGCYHGVVEASLTARGRIDVAELEAMCAAAGNEASPGAVYECVHGLGHGLLGAVELDVPKALRHCDSLSSRRFSTSCHQGVFMEAITLALADSGGHRHAHGGDAHAAGGHGDAGAGPIVMDPADPYRPCRSFDDPYAASCWLFQGFAILRRVGFDADRALKTCDAAPDGRAGRCYESVGHQLAGLFQRDDAWIVEQCGKGRPELTPRCAAGALLALTAMDWSGSRAQRFSAGLPAEWASACLEPGAEVTAGSTLSQGGGLFQYREPGGGALPAGAREAPPPSRSWPVQPLSAVSGATRDGEGAAGATHSREADRVPAPRQDQFVTHCGASK